MSFYFFFNFYRFMFSAISSFCRNGPLTNKPFYQLWSYKTARMRCAIAFPVVSGPIGVDISVQMLSFVVDMFTLGIARRSCCPYHPPFIHPLLPPVEHTVSWTPLSYTPSLFWTQFPGHSRVHTPPPLVYVICRQPLGWCTQRYWCQGRDESIASCAR